MTDEKTVTIFFIPGCARCRAAGEFFAMRGFSLAWHDVSRSMTAKRRMLELTPGNRQVPVVVWRDVVRVGWDRQCWAEMLEEVCSDQPSP